MSRLWGFSSINTRRVKLGSRSLRTIKSFHLSLDRVFVCSWQIKSQIVSSFHFRVSERSSVIVISSFCFIKSCKQEALRSLSAQPMFASSSFWEIIRQSWGCKHSGLVSRLVGFLPNASVVVYYVICFANSISRTWLDLQQILNSRVALRPK